MWSAFGIKTGALNYRPVTVFGGAVFSFDPTFANGDTWHWLDEYDFPQVEDDPELDAFNNPHVIGARA